MPVYQTSTYVQDKLGRHKGYEYSRTGNPTRAALEQCVASLEDGKYGLAFASGMAAETTIMYLFSPGDHIIVSNDVYGGTYRLFVRVLAEYGLKFDFIEMTDPNAVRDYLRPETKAVWIETPSNPLMKLIDITAVAAIAKEHGAKTIVDNTFASPYGQQPLDDGGRHRGAQHDQVPGRA